MPAAAMMSGVSAASTKSVTTRCTGGCSQTHLPKCMDRWHSVCCTDSGVYSMGPLADAARPDQDRAGRTVAGRGTTDTRSSAGDQAPAAAVDAAAAGARYWLVADGVGVAAGPDEGGATDAVNNTCQSPLRISLN